MSEVDLVKMKYLYDNISSPRLITEAKLSEPGVDINWVKNGEIGKTLLIKAISSDGAPGGHEKLGIVRMLLDKGANVNAKDNFGRTAYDYALRKHYEDIKNILEDSGADINSTDRHGKTASYYENWSRVRSGGRKSKRSRRSRKSRRTKRR